jgi:hypothetical protein
MMNRPTCANCGGIVYAKAPAEKLDLCEPCYWKWQDLGKPKRYLPLGEAENKMKLSISTVPHGGRVT